MKKRFDYKFFLVLITVYFSCNSFVLAVKYANQSSLIMAAVTVAIMGISFVKGRYPISQNAIFLMLLGAFNLLMTSVANGYTNAYVLIFLNFLLVCAYCRLFSRQEFYEHYIMVMKILAVFAIGVGLINMIAPSLLAGVNRYAGTRAYYYDTILAFHRVGAIRINGIWGEPGMLAVFLVFALMLEALYVDRQVRPSNYLIFVLGTLLTFSTAGYVCLTLLLVIMLLDPNRSSRRAGVLIATMVMLIGCVLAVLFIPWFAEEFYRAYGKLDAENISFAGRLGPILYNLLEGIKSPLWGHGLRGETFYVDFSFYSGYLTCNTSTTTFLFSSFGLILSGITVYLSWRLAKISIKKTSWVRVLLFLLILMNVNSQAIHLDQVHYLLLFSVFMKPAESAEMRK